MMTMDISKNESSRSKSTTPTSNGVNGNCTPTHGMPINISNTTTTANGAPQECAGCRKQITERFLLRALDMFWHEDCLKCGCCDCRLGEVGSTLYTRANLILCKRDYLRLFGSTGFCAACNKTIPAFEMVMRARSNVYHLECFACQQCNHRFCVGDRFYLCDNKILCEYDYEERLVFANMAYNPNSLAQIKRQATQSQLPSPSQLLNGGLHHRGGPAPPNSGDMNNNMSISPQQGSLPPHNLISAQSFQTGPGAHLKQASNMSLGTPS